MAWHNKNKWYVGRALANRSTNLRGSGNVRSVDIAKMLVLPGKMIHNVDVFCLVMEFWVMNQTNGILVA